ncbi:hypothetical protein NBW16_03930 [Brucella abortus]|nr:hypothetical protein NBW16_03930 [Brucella abortus]
MKSRLTMIAVAGLLAFSTAACTTNEQRTAGYGVGGAALGALAGGAIGGNGRGALTGCCDRCGAGTLLGAAQTRNGTQYCRYRDPYGRIYEAPCQ